MSSSIQVDMFAVRLGASVLLQFQAGTRTVRVLADAGYAKYNVAGKLDLMGDFGDGRMHIDLIIGTHYDGDHLAGLVDVIEREDITIGEAWLPPVADDTLASAGRPLSSDMLAMRFRGDRGSANLKAYLDAKRAVISRQTSLLREVASRFRDTTDKLFRMDKSALRALTIDNVLDEPDAVAGLDAQIAYFQSVLEGANAVLGKAGASHADVDHGPARPLTQPVEDLYTPWIDPIASDKSRLLNFLSERPDRATASLKNLAGIQKSAAKDAITASWLKKVVDALDAKGVPIRCETVEPGEPRRFIWSNEGKRFIPNERGSSSGPVLELLGPSEYLVEKYWKRLPVGTYMLKALSYTLPYEDITPANELSYIMRFEYKGQGILISGDAGCVDFRENEDGDYYPKLLGKLLPIHVMQVAHHAGHNAYFYHSLLEAGFAEQEERSLLLLSHGVDDDKRPSRVFDRFIAEVRKDGDDVELLFTSRPLPERVANFTTLIHAPVGETAEEGDIRLTYDRTWLVRSHAIKAN